MARRRLHGETQKRRKKKSTRILKRGDRVDRVSTTQVPAAFERSPAIAKSDIEFLEAMRTTGVRRKSGKPVSPERDEAAEGIHIRMEEEDQDLFHERMEALDVEPLRDRSKKPSTHLPGEALRAALAAQGHKSGAAATQGDNPKPQSGKPRNAPLSAPPIELRPPTRKNAGNSAPVSAANQADRMPNAPNPAPQPRSSAEPEAGNDESFTRFEEEPTDFNLMASAMAQAGENADLKYEGAAEYRKLPRADSTVRMPERPEDELDLHGKTQEEAIQIVQNYLLTSFRNGFRLVSIITGKGLNSGAGGPVLRNAVVHWLERNGAMYAESFDWAPREHGGDGAIWVLLRNWRGT